MSATLTDDVVATAAERAADVQERRGLNRHGFRDEAGRLCTLASLAAGLGYPPDDVITYVAAPDVMELGERFAAFVGAPAAASSVCMWNNARERTSEQVSAELRRFAEVTRAGRAEAVGRRRSRLEWMLTLPPRDVPPLAFRAEDPVKPRPNLPRPAKARPACFALV